MNALLLNFYHARTVKTLLPLVPSSRSSLSLVVPIPHWDLRSKNNDEISSKLNWIWYWKKIHHKRLIWLISFVSNRIGIHWTSESNHSLLCLYPLCTENRCTHFHGEKINVGFILYYHRTIRSIFYPFSLIFCLVNVAHSTGNTIKDIVVV